MRYEYAIYDILGWIFGVVFNKWNFILVVPFLIWIAIVSSLGSGWWILLSLLVQSFLVCGIVWGVSMGGEEYRNLYRRSLTQKGTFMRYTTIAATIIATTLVAGSLVRLAVPIPIDLTLLQVFSIYLLLLTLILQSILGVIVLLVSMIVSLIVLLAFRSQRRRIFCVSIFRSIVSVVRYIVITIIARYIVVTVVSFLLTHTVWTLSLFVSIFCGWLAYPLIMEVYGDTSPVVPKEYHVTILFEVLVTSFVLFLLARVLIAVWGYRRSNTEGAR